MESYAIFPNDLIFELVKEVFEVANCLLKQKKCHSIYFFFYRTRCCHAFSVLNDEATVGVEQIYLSCVFLSISI